MRYQVRDSQAGNVIESVRTEQEALNKMAEYVKSDKEDGIYEKGFYEIYDVENNKVIEKSQ